MATAMFAKGCEVRCQRNEMLLRHYERVAGAPPKRMRDRRLLHADRSSQSAHRCKLAHAAHGVDVLGILEALLQVSQVLLPGRHAVPVDLRDSKRAQFVMVSTCRPTLSSNPRACE